MTARSARETRRVSVLCAEVRLRRDPVLSRAGPRADRMTGWRVPVAHIII